MFEAGRQIGTYKLIRKLAKGGFGEVWLAEKRSEFVTKKVAVKLPHDEQVDFDTIRHEATVWEQASGHPNVLPLIDADVYDGQVAIVSEYAEGGSLADLLKLRGKLAAREAVELTVGILHGLEFLHSKNIIHRDIKPANILLQGATPRLADFGISRAIHASEVSSKIVGTESYMAPEAFEGVRNVQTDVWSVGVVLYKLLTGNLPFPKGLPSEMMYGILINQPAPLPAEIPSELQRIIYKSLEKDRELNGESPRRYQTAAEMREDLKILLENLPQATPETTTEISPAPVDLADEIRTKMRIPLKRRGNALTDFWTALRFGKFSPPAILAIVLGSVFVAGIFIYAAGRVFSGAAKVGNSSNANADAAANSVFDENAAKNLNEAINYSKQGEIYFRQKQYDSAIDAFSKAIALNPNDFGTYNNRGISYHSKREYEKAIADYTRAVELSPNDFRAYGNRAAAYEDAGDLNSAMNDLRKALELAPNDEKLQKNFKRLAKKANRN